jgi:hypothetical protein
MQQILGRGGFGSPSVLKECEGGKGGSRREGGRRQEERGIRGGGRRERGGKGRGRDVEVHE